MLLTGVALLSACAPQQQQQQLSTEVRNLNYQSSVQSGHLAKLTERVRRVERAMIRLDSRMRLIERNELARFTANQQESQMMNQQARLQPTSFNTTNDIVNFARLNSPFSKRVQPNYAARPGVVTSSLQVAPQQVNAQAQLASAGNTMTSIPSLADKSAMTQEKDVSIWTVEYSDNKIWPTRDQLAKSQEVVSLLKGSEPVAIFARGSNPSSKEFRERVRALSRYLGKVAKSQDVAIATMPATHLDADTIEVLVTK
jgi:outer membrane murein-binding lipoprotein Lpp